MGPWLLRCGFVYSTVKLTLLKCTFLFLLFTLFFFISNFESSYVAGVLQNIHMHIRTQ
ncbi:hypothetical protein BVRB_5g119290 [Beta vulgaris subsp. vulgaris]|nr:hypothetical protein BVRB_5g119290 [Beta vulgaris subsp. vulgaris]